MTVILAPSGDVYFGQFSPTYNAATEADWQHRISGRGVVWYHDFRSDAEVDAFRWAGGTGNDPGDLARPNTVRRNTSDGITGGGCLEIFRPAGSAEGSVWWRPYRPIVGSGNGKGVDDPGADGTITPINFSATQGGSQTETLFEGYYGHASYHAAFPGDFDGEEYYFQCRVKMDTRRHDPGNPNGGKLFYFTLANKSATSQEIVTSSGQVQGGVNYLSMYRSVSPPLENDTPGNANQPGSDIGFCDWPSQVGACWSWSGDWDTLLYRIRPGLDSNSDTIVQVWAAHPGETQYTKIWDQDTVDLPFETRNGHNALICSAYMNAQTFATDIYHRYDQLIFSKDWIPCPNDAPAWWLDDVAVPERQWVEIAKGSGAAFQAGDTINDAATDDSIAVTSGLFAYSGAAVDQQSGKMLIMGGGHGDYNGNEVYVLDLMADVPGWDVLMPRSPNHGTTLTSATNWHGQYDADFGNNGHPVASHTSNTIQAQHGRLWQGIMWGATNGAGGTNQTSARFYLDIGKKEWTALGTSIATQILAEGPAVCLVEERNELWCGSYQASNTGDVFAYVIDTNTGAVKATYTRGGALPLSAGTTRAMGIGCAVGIKSKGNRPPLILNLRRANGQSAMGWYVVDPTAPHEQHGPLTINNTSGLTLNGGDSTGLTTHGMQYHEGADCVYMMNSWDNAQQTEQFLKIGIPTGDTPAALAAATWNVTAVQPSNFADGGRTIPEASADGRIYGRFNIINDMGDGRSAIVLYSNRSSAPTSAPTYIFKLPQGGV